MHITIDPPKEISPVLQQNTTESDHLIETVKNIMLRILGSELLRTLTTIAIIGSIAVAIITAPLELPLAALVASVAMLAIGTYITIQRKELLYEVSLIYTIFSVKKSEKDTWWNQITDHIVLGGIPLKNQNHQKLIVNENVNSVLSVVEDFELENKGLSGIPVTHQDWTEEGIFHYQIKAADFKPLSFQNIEKSVEFLKNQIDHDYKVYVHCKAGRGRSATIVIAYLLKYGNFASLEEAYLFVKERRDQIHLNSKQKEALQNYWNTIQAY